MARPGSPDRRCDRPAAAEANDGQADCHVQRLTYLSTACNPEALTPKVLTHLEEKFRTRNRSVGVGGFMLFSAPFFFEVLEGFPEAVGPLFARLQREPHHTGCVVLLDVRCSERRYPDWRLRGVNVGADHLPAMIPTLLRQLAAASLNMWRFLPLSAGVLLLQGKDPRSHPPQFQHVVVAFVQLVEFDALLAEPALSQHLADLLEAFVDVCGHHAHRTGGQFAKFVNGSSMLFWPATRAVEAYEALDHLIAAVHDLQLCSLSLLSARAGVHTGRAILCNAGKRKADFTLLGDCVNVAARLTSMACDLKAAVVVSAQLRALLGEAGPALCHVGSLEVKGRTEPVECYRALGPQLDGSAVRGSIETFATLCPVPSPRRPVREFNDALSSQQPCIFDHPLRQRAGSATQRHSPKAPSLASRLLCCWPRSKKAKAVTHPWMPEDPGLYEMMYVARLTGPVTEAETQAIVHVLRRRYRAECVTSEAVHIDQIFVHRVEGPVEALRDILQRLPHHPWVKETAVINIAPVYQRSCQSTVAVRSFDAAAETLPLLPELLDLLLRAFQCLETYVPSAMAYHIVTGREPRDLSPTRVSVVMMAADIVSFTLLTEGAPLTEVWHLCATFIDLCTEEIHRHGGHVIQLIGDCVTAYFRPDAAGPALEAACGVFRACREQQRRVHVLDCRSVLTCGVGLDCGPVVMAHCGRGGAAKVVVAGEVSARVLEVEALTRPTGQAIVVSQAVAGQLPPDCPLKPVATVGTGKVTCFAYEGADLHLILDDTKAAIAAYHRECRLSRTGPLHADEEEEVPVMALTKASSLPIS
eukprot:EG_transcript_1491